MSIVRYFFKQINLSYQIFTKIQEDILAIAKFTAVTVYIGNLSLTHNQMGGVSSNFPADLRYFSTYQW